MIEQVLTDILIELKAISAQLIAPVLYKFTEGPDILNELKAIRANQVRVISIQAQTADAGTPTVPAPEFVAVPVASAPTAPLAVIAPTREDLGKQLLALAMKNRDAAIAALSAVSAKQFKDVKDTQYSDLAFEIARRA